MFPLGILFLVTTTATCIDCEGKAVLRVWPSSTFQLRTLMQLGDEVGFEIDYLREPRSVNKPADIVLPSPELNHTQNFLNKLKVRNFVLANDFEDFVQREKRVILDDMDSTAEISRDMLKTHYLSFDMQMRVLHQIAATLPGLVRLEKLGKSYEGRPIIAAIIGIPSHFKKPIFWIDAGIHAREWISHATALYTLWEYATNPEHYDLLRQMEIIIVPNVNPDGYEFSRLSQRLWRKTRSNTTNPECPGVDANRNFPMAWGSVGKISHDPCNLTYCGPHAASEPEVQILMKAITARKERIGGYVALHSFGQDILYPWGHTADTKPDDVEDLIAMGKEMAKAIMSKAGTEYSVINTNTGLYATSGAAVDWAKSIGIKYTYTIELTPDNDKNKTTRSQGHVLPEKYIAQTVTEVFAGLNVLAKKIGQTAFGGKD